MAIMELPGSFTHVQWNLHLFWQKYFQVSTIFVLAARAQLYDKIFLQNVMN